MYTITVLLFRIITDYNRIKVKIILRMCVSNRKIYQVTLLYREKRSLSETVVSMARCIPTHHFFCLFKACNTWHLSRVAAHPIYRQYVMIFWSEVILLFKNFHYLTYQNFKSYTPDMLFLIYTPGNKYFRGLHTIF